MEVAQIPAHSITVLPATGASTGTPVAAAEPAHAGTPVVTTATTSTPWRWIALASLGLWLLSVLAWWLWRRRRAAPASESKPTSVTSCPLAFLAAAWRNHPPAQVRTLPRWGVTYRPAMSYPVGLSEALVASSQSAASAT